MMGSGDTQAWSRCYSNLHHGLYYRESTGDCPPFGAEPRGGAALMTGVPSRRKPMPGHILAAQVTLLCGCPQAQATPCRRSCEAWGQVVVPPVLPPRGSSCPCCWQELLSHQAHLEGAVPVHGWVPVPISGRHMHICWAGRSGQAGSASIPATILRRHS